jgi:hypothetical protein
VKIPYSDNYAGDNRDYGTPLNPFLGVKNTNILRGVPQGSSPPSQGEYNNNFDAQGVRGMGHRGPLVIVGWGYDLQGRPVPNKLSNMSSINDVGDGSTTYYNHEFKSDFPGPEQHPEKNYAPYGGSVQTRDYKAGTLDVRYDNRRGMWTADHSFLAKLTGSEAYGTGVLLGEEATSFYKYKWTEVDHYQPHKFIKEPNPENFKPASSKTSDVLTYAVNLSECMVPWDAEYLSNVTTPFYPPLPSGTIVEMKTYFTFNPGGDSLQPKFIPVCVFDRSRTLGQYVMIESSVKMKVNQGAGLQTSYIDHDNRYIYTGKIIQWMNPSPIQDISHPHFSFAKGFDTEGFLLASHDGCSTLLSSTSPLLIDEVEMVNTVEWTNPVGGNVSSSGVMNPGIDTCGSDYPEGFSMRPISNGTIVFAKPMFGVEFPEGEGSSQNTYTTFPAASGETQPAWSFQLVNHHDGVC